MPEMPGSLIVSLAAGWPDDNGEPLAGGRVYFYTAGTTTEKNTYSDAEMLEPNENPVTLDASGRAIVFLEPGGYNIFCHDAEDVLLWSVDGVEDIGQTFLADLGTGLATGSVNVTSGYTVLDTDQLVTVASTGGANPCVIQLPPAEEYSGILTIKNMGIVALAITPDASDTIDTVAGALTLAAASPPSFPSLLMVSNGVAGWYILASHKSP